MAILIVGIGGFIVLIFGQLWLSDKHRITGRHARLVGLILFLPFLIQFFLQWALTGNILSIDPFSLGQIQFEILQLPLSLVSLIAATLVAYWPLPRQDRYREISSLSDIYPVRDYETLTISQAASELKLTREQVQTLIDDGTLKTNSRVEIERGSFESFLFARQGIAYTREGHLEEALVEFDKAVGLNPQSARAYALRGKINVRLGNFDSAYSDFQQTQKLRPDYPEIAELLARTQKALKAKPGIPNSISGNIRKAPALFLTILVAGGLAILISISAFMDLANYHCVADYSCDRAQNTATAIAHQVTRTALAFFDQINATATASPSAFALQTLAPGRTATAYIDATWLADQHTKEYQTQSAAATHVYPTIKAVQTSEAMVTATAHLTQTASAENYARLITPTTLQTFSGTIYIAQSADALKGINLGSNNMIAITLGHLNDPEFYELGSFVPSPSGEYFVFSAGAGAGHRLWRLKKDGSELVPLTPQNSDTADPSWSPDEKSIAFVYPQHKASQMTELVVTKIDTSNDPSTWQYLTHNFGRVVEPTWSPDGKTIVFCGVTDDGNKAVENLFSVSLDNPAKQPKALTTTNNSCSPAWSSTRNQIAFVQYEGIVSRLLIMNGDGTGVRTILSEEHLGQPYWSPDGKYILIRISTYNLTSLFVIDPDTSNLWDITPDKHSLGGQVSWGP